MKKPIALVILFIAITLMVVYFAAPSNNIHLSDVYTSSFNDVQAIDIVDGTTGESVMISEKDELQRFLGQLEKMEWEEDRWAEDSEGYMWMVRIKAKDEEIQIISNQMGGRKFKHNPEFNDFASSYFMK